MRKSTALAFLLLFGALFCIAAFMGCTPTPPPPTLNHVVIPPSVAPVVNHLVATSHPFVASVVQSVPGIIRAVTSVPPDLHRVSVILELFILLGVAAAGVGVGLYFEVNAKVGAIIAAIGGALTLISLFFRTTLWMSPWISGGIAIAGLVLTGYEVYHNWGLINSDVTGALTPAKPAPPFPDKAPKQ